MIGHSTSFVLRATDYSIFDPYPIAGQSDVVRVGKLALGIIISSVLVPVVGVIGSFWHVGKAIVHLSQSDLAIAYEDISLATNFTLLNAATLAGIGLSPLLLIRFVKPNIDHWLITPLFSF